MNVIEQIGLVMAAIAVTALVLGFLVTSAFVFIACIRDRDWVGAASGGAFIWLVITLGLIYGGLALGGALR